MLPELRASIGKTAPMSNEGQPKPVGVWLDRTGARKKIRNICRCDANLGRLERVRRPKRPEESASCASRTEVQLVSGRFDADDRSRFDS
jgi:hypothetical protein